MWEIMKNYEKKPSSFISIDLKYLDFQSEIDKMHIMKQIRYKQISAAIKEALMLVVFIVNFYGSPHLLKVNTIIVLNRTGPEFC